MRGKRLGFSLEEIREMIDIYDTDRSEVAQLFLVLDKIAQRRANLVERQHDITTMLGELDELEGHCAFLLDQKQSDAPASVRASG